MDKVSKAVSEAEGTFGAKEKDDSHVWGKRPEWIKWNHCA